MHIENVLYQADHAEESSQVQDQQGYTKEEGREWGRGKGKEGKRKEGQDNHKILKLYL